MAVGDFLTWAIQAQDAPAHVARILQTILLNEGVVDVAGGSFQVQEDTGANMQIQVGSGTLGDLAVVEGDDVAGQGVYVHEAQNATVTRSIAASDPSNDRIDLVVLQNYDDEADSSGLNDAEVEVIQGTPAGSPSAPALPDSAISLATILVGAGVTAITNANITDTRAEATVPSRALMGTQMVSARQNNPSSTLSTTEQVKVTATLAIPSDWNTYEIDAWGQYGWIDNGASASTGLRVRLRVGGLGGTQIQEPAYEEIDIGASRDFGTGVAVGSIAGETTTGNVDVVLTTQLDAENLGYSSRNFNLVVRAYRTS